MLNPGVVPYILLKSLFRFNSNLKHGARLNTTLLTIMMIGINKSFWSLNQYILFVHQALAETCDVNFTNKFKRIGIKIENICTSEKNNMLYIN